ncbi:TNT domain-containing protein [Saccharopolyspora griseoalba]|uniref:TNT domain-containing protein n=1 Tax=Saccharopolyspora griseoalba TaxID=1431848 RepID=A0ABW2LGR3_9PSEU
MTPGENVVVREEEPRPVGPRFPERAGFGSTPDRSGQRERLVQQLGELLPAGDAELTCTALGTRLEVAGSVGGEPWRPTDEVVRQFERLRAVCYLPGTGAFTRAAFAVTGPELDFRTTFEQPRWDGADQRHHFDELRYFPRVEAPEWLLAAAWEHFVEHRAEPSGGRIAMAPLFDEPGPQVFRPALPFAEKQQVINYLLGGEILLSANGADADALDPARPPEVPKAFHTDGAFVWPVSMAYYLREHDVAPPRAFLDHIRTRGYQPPKRVSDHAQAQAKALVLGAEPESLLPHDRAELHKRSVVALAEQGIGARFYESQQEEDFWTKTRDERGWWQVARVLRGEVVQRAEFPDEPSAAAYLVGAMTMHRERYQRPQGDVLGEFECPWLPFPEDPPLSAYENRTMAVLPEGAEIDRFGDPSMNTAYVAGTTIPQRGLPSGRPPGEYHRYRVVRPFEVIAGQALPANGQVGGGTAYVLPNRLTGLVEDGWLAEV